MSTKALLAGVLLLIAPPALGYDLNKDWTRDFSKEPDRTVGSAVKDETGPALPRRQPRASDLPTTRLPNSSDEWLDGVNRDVNRKLWICRGC